MCRNSNGFFDRLLAGRVLWSLHTAMTCDLAFVYAIKKKQQGSDLNPEPDCAFFYDFKPGKGRCLTAGIKSPSFSLEKAASSTYKLTDPQTHHAKISLVCWEDDNNAVRCRLAVYSRNMEFSRAIDAGLLFDLKFGTSQTTSGEQLCAYLKRLRDISEKSGQKWLGEHLNPDDFRNVTLVSEFGTDAELYFGGINGNLGALLDLNNVGNNSIVLTPPEFIRGSSAEGFFSGKPILYDHKWSPSHIKLYLLHKRDSYELWAGSANATPSGIGWDFANHKSFPNASIECLVKFTLDEEKFTKLSGQITPKEYKQFDFAKDEGTLQVTPDLIGPYIVSNYKCTAVEINGDDIKYTLEKTHLDADAPEGADKAVWQPAESEKPFYADFTQDEVVLTYNVQKDTQGILLFGTSCCIMDVSGKIPEDKLFREKTAKNTILTEWLLGKQLPESESEKWDDELKFIYRALKGGEN